MTIIILVGIIPYWDVITKGFYLGESFGGFVNAIQSPFFALFALVNNGPEYFNYCRPMTEVLYKIQYIVFGIRPAFFHLVSVLLNGLNAGLLFLLVIRITGMKQMGFLAGLLFALNPLHSEPVSWLIANNIMLCTFFFLAALVVFDDYMKYGKAASYCAALLFEILALLSHEAGVVLPGVLLLYDFLWGHPGLKARIKTHLPFLVVLAFYFMLRFIMLGGLGDNGMILHADVWVYRKEVFIYIPFDFVYPVNREVFTSDPLYIFWISTSVLVVLLFIRRREIKNDYKVLLFSLCLILVPCLPYFGLLGIQKNLWNSRYFYLSSSGFCIFLSWLLMAAIKGASYAAPRVTLVAILITGFYGFILYTNNQAWSGASIRMRAVYNDLDNIIAYARRDEVVFILDPPPLYKGARFICCGYWAIDKMLSKPGKDLFLVPVTTKNDSEITDEKQQMRIYNLSHIKFLIPDFQRDAHYSKAAEILSGAKTPEGLNMNAVLVRWDERTMHLSVLENYGFR